MSTLTHSVFITICFLVACVRSEPPVPSTIGNFGGYVPATSGFKDGFTNQGPSTGYGVPQIFTPQATQNYAQSPSTIYGAPNNPTLNYGTPSSNYGQTSSVNGLLPCSNIASPSYLNYGSPSQSYVSPSQSYVSPSQSFVSPSQSYGTPSQNYGSPYKNSVGSNAAYNVNGNNLNAIFSDGKYYNNYGSTAGYKF